MRKIMEEHVLAVRDEMLADAEQLRIEAGDCSAMYAKEAFTAKVVAEYLEKYAELLRIK